MNDWTPRPQGTEGLPAGVVASDHVEYRLAGDPHVYHGQARELNWRDGPGEIEWYRRLVPAPFDGVGDVTGSAKGTAARFNAQKPDLSLIPAGIMGGLEEWRRRGPKAAPVTRTCWTLFLMRLGDFQMRADGREALHHCLHMLDDDGKLWADVARVFDYGRVKYSKKGACTCHVENADRRHTLGVATDSADGTTRKTFETEIQSSLNGNERTGVCGTPRTQNESKRLSDEGTKNENSILPTKRLNDIGGSNDSMGLSEQSTTEWPSTVVRSAHQRTVSTSTTTTPAEKSVDCYATPATSGSGLSSGQMGGSTWHAPTCGVHRIEARGDWNWARGQAWSVPIASALRHVVFGTMRGENLDPESGLPHRGHIGCNLVMLLWFMDHYPEGDDRYTPPAAA